MHLTNHNQCLNCSELATKNKSANKNELFDLFQKFPLILLNEGNDENKKIALQVSKCPLFLHQKPVVRTKGRVKFLALH